MACVHFLHHVMAAPAQRVQRVALLVVCLGAFIAAKRIGGIAHGLFSLGKVLPKFNTHAFQVVFQFLQV